ncbi:MAG: ribonuclease HII [Candidatus Taylorbacteria bacterium]|nr:ribonuclease HII [Candidatus Taylorbacteria bacterium]
MKYLIGIDEAGRGPLAGPVAVSAFCVLINSKHHLLKYFPDHKVRDSKKLTAPVREHIYAKLVEDKVKKLIFFEVSFASSNIIDKKGISYAIRTALESSIENLGLLAEECLVLLDGSLKAPGKYKNQETIIKGDEKEAVIALASIVAKVSRDRKMQIFDKKYPLYGFGVHKGYGTKKHYISIRKHGLTPVHRKSYLKSVDK